MPSQVVWISSSPAGSSLLVLIQPKALTASIITRHTRCLSPFSDAVTARISMCFYLVEVDERFTDHTWSFYDDTASMHEMSVFLFPVSYSQYIRSITEDKNKKGQSIGKETIGYRRV